MRELVPDFPGGLVGVLDIAASTPFVPLTLRSLLNQRGDFLLTAFPVADINEPAPSPIIFPQIADSPDHADKTCKPIQKIASPASGNQPPLLELEEQFGAVS